MIVLGVAFLGNNYDWFSIDLSFRQFAQWWPLLLVLAGVGVFLTPDKRLGNPLSVLAIAFAIPLAIYSFANDKVEELTKNEKSSMKFDGFDESQDENDSDDDQDRYGSGANESGERSTQHYTVANELGIVKAKLDFGGGAAEFYLEPTSNNLFEANTILTKGSYRLDSDKSGDEMDINFEMIDQKSGHLNISDDADFDNDVYLKLNPKVIWDIKLGIGAGDLEFDLSKFKVEKIKVETGVAAVQLKLSDLLSESRVDVKSGVAKVTLDVPEGVGCRIDLDGAMNSKTFKGFAKVGKDRWETPNFETASKKIYIDLESGLSAINISRY